MTDLTLAICPEGLRSRRHRVAQPLRDAGIEAAHVRDHDLQHATDSMILEFTQQHAFVLVSEDTDFGELLAR